MPQDTIGQRLKFLMDSLGLKIRTFANALDVNETSIRNYTTKDAKPGADILERIALHFPEVNTRWLITGEDEPFLSATPAKPAPQPGAEEASHSQAIANNQDNSTIGVTDCEKKLQAAQKKIALLTDQLADKEDAD